MFGWIEFIFTRKKNGKKSEKIDFFGIFIKMNELNFLFVCFFNFFLVFVYAATVGQTIMDFNLIELN